MTNDTPAVSSFDATRARLRRVLRRVGWTIHLREKKSGWYACAAKRDATGKWRGAYIAKFSEVDEMQTGEIIAVLPPVA